MSFNLHEPSSALGSGITVLIGRAHGSLNCGRALARDFAHPTAKWRFAKVLWDDTQGLIFPYVTMMLVVIIGVAVLALDGARYMTLQTQLQNGADALALAGAA